MHNRKQRLLLVDDNPHFLNAMKFMLEDHFSEKIAEIFTANNGQECLNTLNEKMIDMVFMDINMPVMDGIVATREATRQFRDLKIIAVSFHSEMKYIIQMIEAGARNYIIKEEISPEILEKVLVA